MRKTVLLVLLLLLTGLALGGLVAASDSNTAANFQLQVVFDKAQAQFTLDQLKALPAVEVSYKDRVYKGVPIRTVLSQAGADIGKLEWVEPWGADGYHRRYDRLTSKRFTTILAYEENGQPLSGDEGPLRSVFAGAHGKDMVKQVVKLVAKLGTWRLTLVTSGQAQVREREFTLDELQKLPSQELTVQTTSCPCSKHVYRGTALLTLLQQDKLELEQIKTITAVASDGTSADYKPEQLTENGPLLAYEQDGQPLADLGTVALIDENGVRLKRLERVIITLASTGG